MNAPIDIAQLTAQAFPVTGSDGVVFLPEPRVKRLLSGCGIAIPAGGAAEDVSEIGATFRSLTPLLVLKAWGPGLIHKSDFGAVQLGIPSADEAARAAAAMRDRLLANGVQPVGFLVEEQQRSGIEMIVGVVHRPPFGHFVAVGFGGTLTEIMRDAVLRPMPVDADDVRSMLTELRGAKLLDGARGKPPADREALVALVCAVAGAGGLAARLQDHLAEFEINPVIVSDRGAVAVDGRLLLYRAPLTPARAAASTDFESLFTPRAVAVVGASTKASNFGNMFLKNYRAYGYPGSLYAIHPEAEAIDGVKAYPSLADVPEPVDYALVAAPAPLTPQILRAGKGRVRFAQVMSGGFREAGADGVALEAQLLSAARDAGIRLVGPNCMGAWSARGRQTFLGTPPERAGDAAIISQSGSLGGDILKVGDRLGIGFSSLITIGNSIDVTAGELLEWHVTDPYSRCIGLYLEDPRDGERLIQALHKARAAGKPVVLLVSGLSRQGAVAAASHTGAMAGDLEIWRGIASQTGSILTRSLEEFLDALLIAQIQRDKAAIEGAEVLIMGAGGGCNVLATDACDAAGLVVAPVDRVLAGKLSAQYGAGASFGNPVEVPMGPLNASSIAPTLLKTLNQDAPYPNIMFHVNVQSFYSYGKSPEHSTEALLELAGRLSALSAELPRSRLTWILRNAICADGNVIDRLRRTAHAGGVATFLSFQSAAAAIAAVSRSGRRR